MASKVLVIRGGAIGDFILTLPAIQLLRDGLPEAHLEILGYPAITQLAKETGIAHEVSSIEYASLANFFNPKGDLDSELVEYFSSFNLVISYLYDPDDFFQGNLERCGVKTQLACSHRIDESGDSAPVQLAEHLQQLALFLDNPAPRLDYPEAIQKAALELAESRDHPIAIHPGSGSPTKNWPIESWIDLVDRLRTHYPTKTLFIITGEADEKSAAPLLAHCREHHPDFRNIHRAELPVLGAFLARCALFLGHDSGISHLAAASETRSLLLFGPTNPEIWAPTNEGVEVLRHPSAQLTDILPAEVEIKAAELLAPRL